MPNHQILLLKNHLQVQPTSPPYLRFLLLHRLLKS